MMDSSDPSWDHRRSQLTHLHGCTALQSWWGSFLFVGLIEERPSFWNRTTILVSRNPKEAKPTHTCQGKGKNQEKEANEKQCGGGS